MGNKIYGYCRVSTKKQVIERQIKNIRAAYSDAIIVQESYTGTKMDRPAWNNLMKKLKAGDTVVFDEVSRMSRTADEGCDVYEQLFTEGINLVFLKQKHVSTDVYRQALERQIDIAMNTGNAATDKFMQSIVDALNSYLMDLAKEQIRLAFEQAQDEVDHLHQRTKEGIEAARLHGKQIGQKPGAKLTTKKSLAAKEIIKKHNKDFGGSLSNEETWTLAGISKMSFYKYKSELRSEVV